MLSRRQLIQTGTLAGAAAFAPATLWTPGRALAAPLPEGTLDPAAIPKYVTPLFVLPAMPSAPTRHGTDSYSVAVRRFRQQILPAGSPRTTVFGFGSTGDRRSFHAPGYSIEARADRPLRVAWWNQLVTRRGEFVPHLLPVDPTLHWANPPGGAGGRDSRPEFDSTPGPYRGPLPLVVHLHGAHSFEDSDGYPEAWYLPTARNIPAGYATVGSRYEQFKEQARERAGVEWSPGNAVFHYPNDQPATTLWYHSHTLGVTRNNIYAGLAGMYLLRGGPGDLPPGVLPGGPYEIPLVIQYRTFNADGSLFYPDSRAFFGDTPPDGPWIPETDVPPIWNPEFFGTNVTLVNGNSWPSLRVERCRYRFRVLNADNARTMLLKIASDPLADRPAPPALPIWVIGSDGGFLPAPVSVDTVPLGVAERADVIVDFTDVPEGTRLYLINEGPDGPLTGRAPGVDFEPADPATTGQVMEFVVGPPGSADGSVPPGQLNLPDPSPLGDAANTRQVAIGGAMSQFIEGARIALLLGTVNADGTPSLLGWGEPITEDPARGATEIWELTNFTDHAHPIHIHLVQFEVVDRRPIGGGSSRPPEDWERGVKDTVLVFPLEVTRVKARFDLAGLFVWHCHIVDHEDNEMMRPYRVG